MSTVPDSPVPEPEDPPVVAIARDRLRRSRKVQWLVRAARRHRSVAALAGAAVVVWKSLRWMVLGLFNLEGVDWLLGHWLLVGAAGAILYALAFISIRLGIDWADKWMRVDAALGAAAANIEIGPAWASRPPDASTTYIPPRMS